jgi:hypothetical protein
MSSGWCEKCHRSSDDGLEVCSVFICTRCREKARNTPHCGAFHHTFRGSYCMTCGFILAPQKINADGTPPQPVSYDYDD